MALRAVSRSSSAERYANPTEHHLILLRGTVEREDEDDAAYLSQIGNVRLKRHCLVLS
jgi:hypothetical protein